MRALIAVILITIGSGCSWPTRTVCPDVPRTTRPALPALSAEDVACLTDDAWHRLRERDRGRREYAEDLESILQGIREECNDR